MGIREISFRAWDKKNKWMDEDFYISSDGRTFDRASKTYDTPNLEIERTDDLVIMQFTGLFDKKGVKIFDGDLLNVFFTSGNGEHNHDCIYRAQFGRLGDLQFNFVKLLWEDSGHNQYPSSTSLCARYDTLDYEYEVEQLKLKVPDSWGENHLHRNKWKANDKSFYFEVIGNIHQNPELLEKK